MPLLLPFLIQLPLSFARSPPYSHYSLCFTLVFFLSLCTHFHLRDVAITAPLPKMFVAWFYIKIAPYPAELFFKCFFFRTAFWSPNLLLSFFLFLTTLHFFSLPLFCYFICSTEQISKVLFLFVLMLCIDCFQEINSYKVRGPVSGLYCCVRLLAQLMTHFKRMALLIAVSSYQLCNQLTS